MKNVFTLCLLAGITLSISLPARASSLSKEQAALEQTFQAIAKQKALEEATQRMAKRMAKITKRREQSIPLARLRNLAQGDYTEYLKARNCYMNMLENVKQEKLKKEEQERAHKNSIKVPANKKQPWHPLFNDYDE